MLPKRLWDQVAEFTSSAVIDYMPASWPEARATLACVSRLAAWTVETACLPLERPVVFDGRHIDAYIKRGLTGVNAHTAHNYRLRLLGIASELLFFDRARRDTHKNSRSNASKPYTNAQITHFRSQGTTRTTPVRNHNWMTLLTLASGCGLSSTEILALPVRDVAVEACGIRVTVSGHHGRSVVCLSAWEDDLRRLLASPLVLEHVYVTEQRRDDPTVVGKFLRECTGDGSHFAVDRLRAKWILGHLQAATIPLPQLMEAVGTSTARTFERFFPYLETPDAGTLTRLFRDEDRS